MPLFSTIQFPRTLDLVRSIIIISLRRAQFRNLRSKHSYSSTAFVRTRRACLKLQSLAYSPSPRTCNIVGLCCDHQGHECPGNLGSTCATSLHIFASLHPTSPHLSGAARSFSRKTKFYPATSPPDHFSGIFVIRVQSPAIIIAPKKYFSCYSGSYKKPPGDALPSNSPMPRYA
jgi:hypothetical protein